MPKKLQLSINDPCHENWENMTPAEQGRFCGSCQKQVVDFTNMSDSQLAAFFKKPLTGSVCGRFYDDQLNREIEIPRKRIPWVKYFFQFALPAFFFSAKATAQGNVKANSGTTNCSSTNDLTGSRKYLSGDTVAIPSRLVLGNLVPTPRVKGEVTESSIGQAVISAPAMVLLKGKVINTDDNPVPYASIVLKGTKIGMMTDSNGTFSLSIPRSEKHPTLEVSSVGYVTTEVNMDKQTNHSDLVVQLEPAVLMGEVVVIGYPNISCGRSTTGSITVLMGGISSGITIDSTDAKTNLEKETQPISIKLYPNPVQRNQVVNVEWNNDGEPITLTMVGISGGIMHRQSFQRNKGFNRLAVRIDERWSAGIYVVEIRNRSGSLIKKEKVIVQ